MNSLAPGAQGTLIATDGATARPYGQWVYDLMERGRTGRVLSLDIASGRVRPIASGLSYAFGACTARDAVFVSESWRHLIIAIAQDGSRRVVLENLPVYPSRLSPAASSRLLLTAFAAHTQLLEFVLRENSYPLPNMAGLH